MRVPEIFHHKGTKDTKQVNGVCQGCVPEFEVAYVPCCSVQSVVNFPVFEEITTDRTEVHGKSSSRFNPCRLAPSTRVPNEFSKIMLRKSGLFVALATGKILASQRITVSRVPGLV